MKRQLLLLLGAAIFPNLMTIAQSASKTKIDDLLKNAYYGVPSSPAFELLTDKPTEVTHIGTPRDLVTFMPISLDGGTIKSNVGFDIRPFSYFVGSLKDYQDSKVKQVLWRAVLSGGTSTIKDSKDVLIASGLRIPIFDRGDPRANVNRIKELEKAATDIVPDSFDDDDVPKNITKKLDSIRDAYNKEFWNAFRLDLGIGNVWQSNSARMKKDSIMQNKFGAWLAASIPVCKKGQIIVSAKNYWMKTTSDTLETSRASAGARFRVFFNKFAVSAEYAKIWSSYSEKDDLNENWNHFSLFLEVPIKKLNGVIGVAYGGDSKRREKQDAKFEFKYSFYTDRKIKQ